MTGEWRHMSLQEAGVQLLDCEHRTPPPAETGYPYITIPQVKDGRLDLSDVRLISSEHFADWTRKARPREWDVILSRRCNPGETAVVPAGLHCALGQNLVLLRANGKHVLPEFLRWLARSPAWWQQVHSFINVGAVFDSLKCADIPNFRLLIPPLQDQRSIARILGALDGKIELNRRMNETLEAMARALFKSWFVDFDPVRAKAGGRDPGLPKHLADLLPDRLVDSELGEIPDGWRASTIAELARIVGGSTPSTTQPAFWKDGRHCWATPKDLAGLSTPVLLTTERKITDAGVSHISSGLLPPGTVLLSSRAPIGYLAITQVPVAINQGFIAMLPEKGVSSLFLLLWAEQAHEDIISRANGSTFLEVSKANFRPIPVIRPPLAIFRAFEKLAGPLFTRAVSNERESRTLAALRDALLPKLISGEIRVRDAEALGEAALAVMG